MSKDTKEVLLFTLEFLGFMVIILGLTFGIFALGY